MFAALTDLRATSQNFPEPWNTMFWAGYCSLEAKLEKWCLQRFTVFNHVQSIAVETCRTCEVGSVPPSMTKWWQCASGGIVRIVPCNDHDVMMTMMTIMKNPWYNSHDSQLMTTHDWWHDILSISLYSLPASVKIPQPSHILGQFTFVPDLGHAGGAGFP